QDFNAVVHPLQERIARVEASVGDLDRTARRSLDTPLLPQRPFAVWSFDADTRDDTGSLHLKSSAEAEVAAGRLRPVAGKESATVTSSPISIDIREKTLEAWIYVRKIP